MRKILLLALQISLGAQSVLFGQTDHPAVYEDPAAYEVYSTILSWPDASRMTKSKRLVIRRETLRSQGAFIDGGPYLGGCLRPDAESAKLIGTAIDDHIRMNKTNWRLLKKFKLQIPYQFMKPPTAIFNNEDWDKFYRAYRDSAGFVYLSAVGFNADKTVAVVSIGHWCGGLCGEGQYHVLQKKDGRWIPLEWKGDRCSWES